jgi:hypothetical protein
MSTLQYVRDTSTNKNRVLEVDSSCKLSVNDSTAQSSLSLINGKITTCDTSAIVVSSSALPSGASTSANQSTANLSLASIDGKITACDTSNIEVVASSLPSGASTSALQTSANSTLSDIDSKLGGTLTTSAGVSRASGNLAVASSVTSGDVSSSVDANSYKNIAVFGNLGASGDVEIQVSNDNSNWYTSDKQIYSNYSSYDLYGSFQCDARYIRVKYNITGTITIRYALMA